MDANTAKQIALDTTLVGEGRSAEAALVLFKCLPLGVPQETRQGETVLISATDPVYDKKSEGMVFDLLVQDELGKWQAVFQCRQISWTCNKVIRDVAPKSK